MGRLHGLLVALGVAMDDDERAQWECRQGYHVWGVWMHDVTPVPIVVDVRARDNRQLGWAFHAIAGPSYRSCQRSGCAAMERRTLDE